MRLFRSEEHIDRWLDGRARGAVTSVGQLADLAHAWWSDRVSPDWRPKSRDESQAILESVGFTEPFWQLG
jgi:hypothetical protein